MTDFKKLFKQYWYFGILAAIAIVLLTIISATGGDLRQSGSSYSIAPNGYSAWYQLMKDRGINIQRWQKSFAQLAKIPAYKQGTTLIQINPELERWQLTARQQRWVRQGNTLVILGILAPAGEMPFRANLKSSVGAVRIATTRRFRFSKGKASAQAEATQKPTDLSASRLPSNAIAKPVLRDRYGTVISQFTLDSPKETVRERGRIILATTPYLAANAYQEFRPNYELLSKLVNQDRQQILVDEYIHGYIDRESRLDTKTGDVFAYLTNTPLVIVFVNLLLGILVSIWQQNRRFGKVTIPKLPEIDNSEAYIQALGGVLRQANSSEFVLQNIGRSKQLAWQQQLGLGKARLVESQILITAWENLVRLPADDLRFVIQLTTGDRRLTPAELKTWLTKICTIDLQLKRD
jgi:hypothetical protein